MSIVMHELIGFSLRLQGNATYEICDTVSMAPEFSDHLLCLQINDPNAQIITHNSQQIVLGVVADRYNR